MTSARDDERERERARSSPLLLSPSFFRHRATMDDAELMVKKEMELRARILGM